MGISNVLKVLTIPDGGVISVTINSKRLPETYYNGETVEFKLNQFKLVGTIMRTKVDKYVKGLGEARIECTGESGSGERFVVEVHEEETCSCDDSLLNYIKSLGSEVTRIENLEEYDNLQVDLF